MQTRILFPAANMVADQQPPSPPPSSYYTPIPPDPPNLYQPPPPENYILLLPLYPRRRRRHTCPINHALICLASLLLFLLALFFLYPSDPDLTIVRIKLNHIKLHTIPHFSLDISMDTTVRVQNRDYYSLDYDSLVVSIGYRGETLGLVKSDGGVMKARGSSYVNATVVLDGIQIFSDVIYLIEDFAKGTIPFDTLTEVSGTVGLLFFHIPIKAKVSCEVSVDTTNQTITRQDCYPQ